MPQSLPNTFRSLGRAVEIIRLHERSIRGVADDSIDLRPQTVSFLRLFGSAKADFHNLRRRQPHYDKSSITEWLGDAKLPEAPAELCRTAFKYGLIDLVEEVREDHRLLEREQVQAVLRSSRRWVKYLRTAYSLLSKGHTPAPEFNEFCRRLGALNDMLKADIPPPKLSDELKSVQRLGRVVMRNQPWLPFRQASREEVTRRLERHGRFLARTLPRFGAYIGLEDFHQTRKYLDEVSLAHRLIGSYHNTPQIDVEYRKFFALVWEMGQLHDRWVRRVHRTGIRYDKQRLKIPRSMHSRLRQLAIELTEKS